LATDFQGAKMSKFAWGRVLFATSVCVVTAIAPSVAERRTVSGAGLGAIPDGQANCAGYGAPLNVTFSISGLIAPLGSVRVQMQFNPAHAWVGDLDVTLLSPGGTASMVLFSRTGVLTASPSDFGDSSDTLGPYTFVDHFDATGAGNWWAVAAATGSGAALPAGRYRTSSAGTNASGGVVTEMNSAFSNLTTAQINGTWTLRFRDRCVDLTGSVSSAVLSVGNPAVLDFDGDGATDHVVVRNTGGGPTGAVTWLANVPPSALFFYDGFESNNTTAWSSTVP